MLLLRTILHPTDFSPAAEEAFQLAGSLARDHGARLVVLHVNPLSTADEIPHDPVEEVERFKEKIWEEFHRLEAIAPRIREVRLECKFVDGDPAREILRLAELTGCDLIVMGTHGRTGLTRLLMGSVAEKVLRKAPCPVLTVKTMRKAAAASDVPVAEVVEA
jgi:nucleotide-binding universal stress UspA family protein